MVTPIVLQFVQRNHLLGARKFSRSSYIRSEYAGERIPAMPRMGPSRPRNPSALAQGCRELPWGWFLGLLLLHIPLAWLMKKLPVLASAHAALTLLVALVLALRNVRPGNLVAVIAYLISSEVLWRMAKAAVPWEFGKYAVTLIALVALVRRWPKKPGWLPVFYFALLVPSAFLTLGTGEFDQVRQDLSFNLSGPLSLAVLMFYLSGVRLSLPELTRSFQFLLMPVAAVCSIASFTVLTAENLVFDDRANNLASGGIAANQVSAILGLGVFVAFLYSLNPNQSKTRRVWLLAIAAVFLAQCALTFSRTGIYLAAVSALVVILMLARDVKRMLVGVGGVCLLAGIMAFLIWPALDRFTDGALTQRFQRTDSTGRDEILMSDIKIFRDNPLLGIGVGRSRQERSQFITKVANAHTEFSRLCAEHGSLGLLALLVLLFMVGKDAWQKRFSYSGAVAAGAVTWSLLFMLVSAMRLAAPAFLLGLSCVQLIPSSQAIRSAKAIRPVPRQRWKPPFRPGLVFRKTGATGTLFP